MSNEQFPFENLTLETSNKKIWVRFIACLLIGIFGILFRFLHLNISSSLTLIISGSSVVAAAFLLAWTAEALHVDVSSGLAIAVLALIAVLPEYAVDFYYTWEAASKPEYVHLAAANMTGANRLLIGVGWSLVVLLSTMVWRKSKTLVKQKDPRTFSVELGSSQSVEWTVLLLATLWSFSMPILGKITVFHGVGMLFIFGYYIYRIRGHAEEEPELTGVASFIGTLPKMKRRLAILGLLLFSGGVLLCCAEPFAESIVHVGKHWNIDEFILAQWLAPLASEAPELLVAIIFSLRGHGHAGFATLLASKVNQWTLLVGTLPFVYSGALGKISALPLGERQQEELLLTAAQGLLGISMLANGRMERWEAFLLLSLFLIQIPFPDTKIRYGMSLLYLVIAIILLFRFRRQVKQHLVTTWQGESAT